jgi:hypothetical protein
MPEKCVDQVLQPCCLMCSRTARSPLRCASLACDSATSNAPVLGAFRTLATSCSRRIPYTVAMAAERSCDSVRRSGQRSSIPGATIVNLFNGWRSMAPARHRAAAGLWAAPDKKRGPSRIALKDRSQDTAPSLQQRATLIVLPSIACRSSSFAHS